MCLGKWNKQTQSSLPFSPSEAEPTCSGISSSISTGQGLSLTSTGPSTGPTSWTFTLQVYFTLLTWWVYTGSLPWLCILHAPVFFQSIHLKQIFMVIHLLGVWSRGSLCPIQQNICVFPHPTPHPSSTIRTLIAHSDLIE